MARRLYESVDATHRQLTLTVAAVIVRAWSEATNAATWPTSSSVAARPVSVESSQALADRLAPSKSAGIDSGTPPVRSVTVRIPYSPSSTASCRRIASTAWKPVCSAPSWKPRGGSPSPPKNRITPPSPCSIIRRAAARAVRNVRAHLPRRPAPRSPRPPSRGSRVPCTSPCEIRLKEMSMRGSEARVLVDRALVERVDLRARRRVDDRALALEGARDGGRRSRRRRRRSPRACPVAACGQRRPGRRNSSLRGRDQQRAALVGLELEAEACRSSTVPEVLAA